MNYRHASLGVKWSLSALFWLVMALPINALRRIPCPRCTPCLACPPRLDQVFQSVGVTIYPQIPDCTVGKYRPQYNFYDSMAKGETQVIPSRWHLDGYWKETIVLIAPPSGETLDDGCIAADTPDAPYRVAWIAKPEGSDGPWVVVNVQDAVHTIARSGVEKEDIRWKFDHLPGGERTLLIGGSNRLGYGESWQMLVYRDGNLVPLKWVQSYVPASIKNHGTQFKINAATGEPITVFPPCHQFTRNQAGEISGIAIGIYCLGEIIYDDALAVNFYLFPFDSAGASFSLNSVADLPEELPFTMGAIASPYILPRNPFDRVAAVSPDMTPAEADGEVEPAPELDAICTEFSGLDNFTFYIGTTSGPANSAETIDPTSIRAFTTLNSSCPADQLPEIDAVALGIAQDFSGRWWNSESCRADTLHLPQVNPTHPSACDPDMPDGALTVMGPYLIASYPACPILKRLVRQYQFSPDSIKLAVRLDGVAMGGATWYGYAPIRLVDGEWDSRFLPPAPPGTTRHPASSQGPASCNPPAARRPEWPWWHRQAHTH